MNITTISVTKNKIYIFLSQTGSSHNITALDKMESMQYM